MNDLALHPITDQQLKDFINVPSHAVMLVGPSGSGKGTIALKLAEEILDLKNDSLVDYPYKLLISSIDGKAIGIEAIRQLEHFLSLKVPRNNTYNRVVIIENTKGITLEAQNAFLKTLEEPPQGTFIVVNTSHVQELLPTVRSRSQMITIKRPDRTVLMDHFKSKGHDDKLVSQVYAISGGLPGLMSAILDQDDHPLLQATEKARKLLSANTYERLLMVDELSKQRQLAQDTIFIMQQMARVSLRSATDRSSKKWQTVLSSSFDASKALSHSAQPKLALTSFVLSF